MSIIAVEKKKWYAVFTRPKAEKKVFERLNEEGFEVYLPLVTTVRQWSDRKKKIQSPLISSYVFVRIQEKHLRNVLPVHGVVTILKHLGKPAVIQDYEIENIKILMQDTENIVSLKHDGFVKGEAVEVLNGPFAGLRAEYVQFQGRHRVVVKTEALGSVIEVNVPLKFIKKLS